MLDLKKTLTSKRVVGVTCASTSREVLERQAFDICILDECSQVAPPFDSLALYFAHLAVVRWCGQ
jgi:hypothetical protein